MSDDNDVRGEVAVVDPATGQQTSSFEVRVNAERRGLNGAAVAMFVAGVADPTGFVDLGTTAVTAMSATVNRGGTAAAMSADFAIETLRQIYGNDRAKAAAKEREARAKARSPFPCCLLYVMTCQFIQIVSGGIRPTTSCR